MKLSRQVELLEDIFKKLNSAYFNNSLSVSVITIQTTPRSYGHFTPYEAWEDGKKGYYEINIGAEHLHRPLEHTIATMQHEMVHQYCFENDIQDVSRGNTYHNKRFKAEAEKRNLIIEYAKNIGWSLTTPSPALIDFCNRHWKDEMNISRKLLPKKVSKKSSTRKYYCPICNASVRATKEVHLICADDHEPMLLAK